MAGFALSTEGFTFSGRLLNSNVGDWQRESGQDLLGHGETVNGSDDPNDGFLRASWPGSRTLCQGSGDHAGGVCGDGSSLAAARETG